MFVELPGVVICVSFVYGIANLIMHVQRVVICGVTTSLIWLRGHWFGMKLQHWLVLRQIRYLTPDLPGYRAALRQISDSDSKIAPFRQHSYSMYH